MVDSVLGIAIYGIPAWIIVGVVLSSILVTIAGLAYVVLTHQSIDE